MKIKSIMPMVAGLSKVPVFEPAIVCASDSVQAARLAVCLTCHFNQQGVCRQCCGGVPVTTLIHLTASRCGRNFWKQ